MHGYTLIDFLSFKHPFYAHNFLYLFNAASSSIPYHFNIKSMLKDHNENEKKRIKTNTAHTLTINRSVHYEITSPTNQFLQNYRTHTIFVHRLFYSLLFLLLFLSFILKNLYASSWLLLCFSVWHFVQICMIVHSSLTLILFFSSLKF